MSDKKEMFSQTKKWIEALKSEDKKTVLKALIKIENKGNESLIIPLINLGVNRDDEEIREVVQRILFNLKISSAHSMILDELDKMGANSFRKELIAAVWNAEIDGMDHLDTFVRIAVEGSFYESIECLTVIEESTGELVEEKILDSLLLLKNYMDDPAKKNDEKNPIIQSIFEKVSRFNSGIV
jgi:hypothetical protein